MIVVRVKCQDGKFEFYVFASDKTDDINYLTEIILFKIFFI